MNEVEFDQAVTDLTNFLVYLGEPAILKRYKNWRFRPIVFVCVTHSLLFNEKRILAGRSLNS